MENREIIAALVPGPVSPAVHHGLVLAGWVLVALGVLVLGASLRRRPARDDHRPASGRQIEADRQIEAFVQADGAPFGAGSGDEGPARMAEPAPAGPEPLAAGLFTDAGTWAAVDAAVADTTSPTGQTWPYAVLLGREDVTVLLAGREVSEPFPPWRTAEGGWRAPRAAIVGRDGAGAGGGGGPGARGSDTFVVLGAHGEDAVLLDLARAPGFVSVTGDPAASRALVGSLLAQYRAVPGTRGLLASGTFPGTPHAPVADGELTVLLDTLPTPPRTTAPPGPPRPPTLLVCSAPTPNEAVRLRAAASGAGGLRVLVLGEVAGSRWRLTVDAGGLLAVDGLGLTADCRVLPGEVPGRRDHGAEPSSAALGFAPPSKAVAPSPQGDLENTLELHPALGPVPERGPDPAADLLPAQPGSPEQPVAPAQSPAT